MNTEETILILKQQRDYWSYEGPLDKMPPAARRDELVKALDNALAYLEKQKEPEVLPDTKDLENSVAGRDFVPTEWVDTLDKYGKWKIVKQGQTERDKIMKTKELMLGDWIYHPLFERHFKVIEIYEKCVFTDGVKPVLEDQLEPIFISSKILEKNGFQYDGEYVLADDYYDITAKLISDGIWQIEYECVEMSGIPSSRVNVSYVHEFQHFLLLCGIEKEIVI